MASTPFPAEGTFDVPGAPGDFTNQDMSDAEEAWLAANKHLLGAEAMGDLDAAATQLIPTVNSHRIQPNGAAASQTIYQIATTNFREGETLLLKPLDPAKIITIHQQAANNIRLAGGEDYVMDETHSAIWLLLLGSTWVEIMRAGRSPIFPAGKELITASGSFVVPTGITTLYVTAVGCGGGGGEGATSAANGNAGGIGAAVAFDSITASGGAAGGGGFITGSGGTNAGAMAQAGHNGNGSTQSGQGGKSFPTALDPYGRGGKGGDGAYGGGGGASGASGAIGTAVSTDLAVTPGATLTVTVGAAGAGGTGTIGEDGAAGTAGAVLVEW